MKTRTQQIEELQKEWTQPRWEGITRPYSAEEVVKLRGSVNPECTLAQLGAAKMWRLLHGESKKGYINSLGALTGGQALQQAKAGIEAFSRSLAKEMGSRQITVNSVAPGFIATEMTEQLSEDIRKKMSDQVALNRLGDPQDIANAVSFLASDKANYITGTVMHVNGGLYMS